MGEWHLKAISHSDAGMIAVGPAYAGYPEYSENKLDAHVTFSLDGGFASAGFPKDFAGNYETDESISTPQAVAIRMDFTDGIQALAVCGIRVYQNGAEVKSLTLAYGGNVYPFLRPEQ